MRDQAQKFSVWSENPDIRTKTLGILGMNFFVMDGLNKNLFQPEY